jgi:hypothetical protein
MACRRVRRCPCRGAFAPVTASLSLSGAAAKGGVHGGQMPPNFPFVPLVSPIVGRHRGLLSSGGGDGRSGDPARRLCFVPPMKHSDALSRVALDDGCVHDVVSG